MEPILDVIKIMYTNLKDNYELKSKRDGKDEHIELKYKIDIFESIIKLIENDDETSKNATLETRKDMLSFTDDYENYYKNTDPEELDLIEQIEIYIKHFKDYKMLNKYCNMLTSEIMKIRFETEQSSGEPGKFILSAKLIKSVYFDPNGQIQIVT